MRGISKENGFSLIELTIVIVVIGILSSIAMQSMNSVIDDIRYSKTEKEMEMLAFAITGNPKINNGGTRSDFGYFGDVGSFPPNLDALYSNPGSYTSWDGPYIPAGFEEDFTGFKKDEWGTTYSYSGGISITSTGSGSTIRKKIANSSSDYLLNSLNGTVKDINDSLPGIVDQDSVNIEITYPNGSGGYLKKTVNPDAAGNFSFDSLPAGNHLVEAIYIPNVDTLTRYVTILPKNKGSINYIFSQNYFSTAASPDTMLTQITGLDTIFTNPDCNNLSFWVENNTGFNVTLSSIIISWSSPTAYYKQIIWNGVNSYTSNNPRTASGDNAILNNSRSINDNSLIQIEILGFHSSQTGGSSTVDMSNTIFTILFSDGSTFDISTGACQ